MRISDWSSDVCSSDLLDTYWPRSVADNAREWVVENVTQGRVDRATGALAVTVPEGDFSAAQITAFSGTLAYRDVAVHYLRPLEPIEALAGTATFDLDALHFDVTSGRLKGLVVKRSEVDITGLSTADAYPRLYELLSISAKAAGPVHDALSILDHPRLDQIGRA